MEWVDLVTLLQLCCSCGLVIDSGEEARGSIAMTVDDVLLCDRVEELLLCAVAMAAETKRVRDGGQQLVTMATR